MRKSKNEKYLGEEEVMFLEEQGFCNLGQYDFQLIRYYCESGLPFEDCLHLYDLYLEDLHSLPRKSRPWSNFEEWLYAVSA